MSSEECTTPNLVELSHRRLEAVNRRDLDAVMSFFATDAVWDMSPIDLGLRRGHAAIRTALSTWWNTFPEITSELDEVLDLGGGVVFQVVAQRGTLAGSSGEIRQRAARVFVIVDGLVEQLTSYNDIDEARAAAQLLAASRMRAPEHLDMVRGIYAAWERGDYSSLEWAHPEIEYTIADGPSPGTWTGVAGMVEGFREVLAAWEDWGVVATDYLALPEDRVLVSFYCTGRGKTSGVELAQLGVDGATLFAAHNGKITRIVQYFEKSHALADLGMAG